MLRPVVGFYSGVDRKKFSQPSGGDDKDAEIGRLRHELTRVTEERDILKKATAYFPKDAK